MDRARWSTRTARKVRGTVRGGVARTLLLAVAKEMDMSTRTAGKSKWGQMRVRSLGALCAGALALCAAPRVGAADARDDIDQELERQQREQERRSKLSGAGSVIGIYAMYVDEMRRSGTMTASNYTLDDPV